MYSASGLDMSGMHIAGNNSLECAGSLDKHLKVWCLICYGFVLRSIRRQRNAASTHWSNPLLGAASLCFRKNVEQRAKNIEFLLACRKKLIDNQMPWIYIIGDRSDAVS